MKSQFEDTASYGGGSATWWQKHEEAVGHMETTVMSTDGLVLSSLSAFNSSWIPNSRMMLLTVSAGLSTSTNLS